MANKSINSLDNASSLANNDLLVLWQASTNTAKNMTGQQFTTWLTALAAGHGGISTIAKTGTAGLVDTYTITYADTSTTTFTVTNGAKGDTGDQTYVWLKYSNTNPTSDADMGDYPAPWIGISVGTNDTAPSTYTDYVWYQWKGDKGDTGNSISSIAWSSNSSGGANPYVPGSYDTYNVFVENEASPIGTFAVYNGTNGAGSVSSVNELFPDSNGNVSFTISSVGDLGGLTVGSATISDAYAALNYNQMLVCPVTDFATAQRPYVGGAYATTGTVEIYKADSATVGWATYHGENGKDIYTQDFSGGFPAGTWTRMIDKSSIVSEEKTFAATSVSAGVNNDFSLNIAKSGYTALGFASVSGSGTTAFRVTDFYISSGTTAHIWAINTADSSRTVTWKPFILYIKN